MARARARRAASPSRRPTRRSPTRRCCCARCSTPRPSATRCGCGRRTPYLARGGVAHDGEVATRLGLPAIPAFAETIALATHPRCSCARPARACTSAACRARRASSMVRRAQSAKACRSPATSPSTMLHLCDMDIGYFDAHCRLDAAAAQRARPRRAARARSPTARSTRSAPTTRRSTTTRKQLPFGEAEPGATGLELLLPLTLKWAQAQKLPLAADARAHHVRAGARARHRRRAARRRARRPTSCIFDPAAPLESRAGER